MADEVKEDPKAAYHAELAARYKRELEEHGSIQFLEGWICDKVLTESPHDAPQIIVLCRQAIVEAVSKLPKLSTLIMEARAIHDPAG